MIPLAVALIAALFNRRGSAPSAAAVAALKAAALPVTCFLLAVYLVMLAVTAHHEILANRILDARMANEGRYFAALAHVSWPGRVP